MNKIKLSKTQREVLELLKKNWRIGWWTGCHPSCWLQEGRVGYGGPSKRILISTFFALRDRDLLKEIKNKKYATEEYTISKKGQELIQ